MHCFQVLMFGVSRLVKHVHYSVLLFWFGVGGIIISIIGIIFISNDTIFYNWNISQWVLSSMIGVTSILGTIMMTKAVCLMMPSKVMMVRSSEVIAAYILQVILFGEPIHWSDLVGSICVIFAVTAIKPETEVSEFECHMCDFKSIWKNGLAVHMARKHSQIEWRDGNAENSTLENPDDDKYENTKDYWEKGHLGGGFQTYIDALEVIGEMNLSNDEMNDEKARILRARKKSLRENCPNPSSTSTHPQPNLATDMTLDHPSDRSPLLTWP